MNMLKKQNILAEIRQSAKENGGSPLGQNKFEEATGIRRYDWRKYWARFSEAQREAGLSPNRFSTAPTDKDLLLRKVVSIIRKLGKFPTGAELRVERQNDPELPSEGIWYRRFGKKGDFTKEIIAYCQKLGGCEDVIELSTPFLVESEDEEFENKPRDTKVGVVYLVRSGAHYKIGKTNASGRREYELALQLPEKIRVIHTITTDDPNGVEAYWHKRFESKRQRGEWFDLSRADVETFKRWKRIA